MRIVTIVSFVCFGFLVQPLSASAVPSHLWSQRFGGTSNEAARAVAMDAAGNVFVTGTFNGTADFGGGGLNSAGGEDIFVAKYNASGAHQWSKRFGSTGADGGRGLAVDGSGNVVVTGYFSGTVNFGGGDLTSLGAEDIFVVRFDTDGVHLWSRLVGGTGADRGLAITTDASDNMVVTGFFRDSAEFGVPGDPGTNVLTSAGSIDGFVAAYSSSGVHLWGRRFGGTSDDEGLAVCMESGGVIVTGDFWDSADFGAQTFSLVSAGANDIFVLRLDAAGTYQWAKRYGGIGNDYGNGVAPAPGGGYLVVGGFSFSTDFGGGSLGSVGGQDIFLSSYTSAGAHQWSRRFGNTGDDYAFGVGVDGSGSVAMTGGFQSLVDFGAGGVLSSGFQDVFIAQYDASGVFRWAQTGGNGSSDFGYAIAVDATGNIVAAGSFRTSINLGGLDLTAIGGADVFVAKYSVPATPVAPAAIATLAQNHPNPFNPSTTIEYSLTREATVVLGIYDASGRLVARLDQGVRGQGAHRVTWDGRNGGGRPAASGVYFYRLDAGATTQTRKMVLLK